LNKRKYQFINGTSFRRFTIYLQTGPESEPEQVAFVFDARFNYGDSHKKIVTNHKKHGTWGSEEDGDCPFVFNEEEDFKIKILVEDDSFKVGTVSGVNNLN